MCFHEAFEINIGAFVTIYLLKIPALSWLRFFPAFLVTDTTWQINVTSLKYALVKIVVKCSSANRNLIGMARLKEYNGHYCESEYEYAFIGFLEAEGKN